MIRLIAAVAAGIVVAAVGARVARKLPISGASHPAAVASRDGD